MAKRATKRTARPATAKKARRPATRATGARTPRAAAARKAAGSSKQKGSAGHGGRREGAGRKPKLDARGNRIHPPHVPRPQWRGRRALLIVAPLSPGVPDLAKGKFGKIIQAMFAAGYELEGFRVLAYGVERKQLRYVVEAVDAKHLSTGMKSLGSRIALTINPLRPTRGRVFASRYQMTLLEPAAVKKAVADVAKHAL